MHSGMSGVCMCVCCMVDFRLTVYSNKGIHYSHSVFVTVPLHLGNATGSVLRLPKLNTNLARWPQIRQERSNKQHFVWGGGIQTRKQHKTPWLSVRKWTIPTDWPPRPGKLVPTSAGKACCVDNARGPYDGYTQFYRPEPLLFLPSSFSIILTRLSGPRSTPTTSRKIW
jgi:hypothetical protein